jgi:regulator of sirC expression with transglutaminase-like and TPR domain
MATVSTFRAVAAHQGSFLTDDKSYLYKYTAFHRRQWVRLLVRQQRLAEEDSVHRRAVLISGGIASWLWLAPSFAQRANPHISTLRAFLELPDAQIDFGRVKLAIDQMIDPKTDIAWAEQQLEQMVAAVSNMLAQQFFARRIPATMKADALRAYLYLPSAWNKNRVFKYDLENDPTGKKILANSLIPTYLRTGRGNCVSMPILFLILAQRLGIDVTLSTAPEHLFAKFRDESGIYRNLECTHECGPKLDSSYVREFEITDKAIENRVYLQPLNKKQVIVAMACTLGTHYYDKKDAAGLDALANLMLEYQPNCLSGVQTKAAAYAVALDVRYRRKYRTFEDIPPEERDVARLLMRQVRDWNQKAETLGWRPPSKAFEAAYQRVIKGARETQ